MIDVTDKLVTAENKQAVSLGEFKQHIKWNADDASEDLLMSIYIAAATEQAQLFTGRQFVSATWQLLLNTFPVKVKLTKSPVSAVSSVQYYDTNNALQTLSSSEYKVKDGGAYGLHTIHFDGSIPSIYDKPDAVIIQYVAGYSSVPDTIKAAILIQAANYFANRESEVVGSSVNQLMFGCQQLLYPYKTFYHNS